MDISQKLLQARQEAGLSQRQLCGDYITRNMLSQLEHGTAKPSLDTLQYLAERLGKPVSYFLEDETESNSLTLRMAEARKAYTLGDYETVLRLFGEEAAPELEICILAYLSRLAQAKEAILQEKYPLAQSILRQAEQLEKELTLLPELTRRRLLLQGKLPRQNLELLVRSLPSLDEELQLRAAGELEVKHFNRAEQLLDVVQRPTALCQLLRGKALFGQKQYRKAITALKLAEGIYPEVYPLLEACCRELEDYKMAYYYACKQK